jgi:alpha-galactosidase
MKRIISFLCITLLSGIFHIKAQSGCDTLALTPPMGWNSWHTFRLDINEDLVKDVADVLIEKGLKDAGYDFGVIDDGWQIDWDDNGNIVVDEDKFPSGIKSLADYIHSKGLKFGIYSDAGYKTCGGFSGSRGYE